LGEGGGYQRKMFFRGVDGGDGLTRMCGSGFKTNPSKEITTNADWSDPYSMSTNPVVTSTTTYALVRNAATDNEPTG